MHFTDAAPTTSATGTATSTAASGYNEHADVSCERRNPFAGVRETEEVVPDHDRSPTAITALSATSAVR